MLGKKTWLICGNTCPRPLTALRVRGAAWQTTRREVWYYVWSMITAHQKEIVVGTILGDGCLYRDRFGGVRLDIKQSNKHRGYVFWLFDQLRVFCPVNGRPRQRSDTKQWRFVTSQTSELAELRRMFYPHGKKIIPHNISEYLTSPLSLAVWYMDDGKLDFRPKYHYSFSLCTNAFTIEENQLLKDVLQDNFDLKVNIQTPLCRGVRYPELYIGVASRDRFLSLIRPYTLDCFQYKLPPCDTTMTPQRLIPATVAG